MSGTSTTANTFNPTLAPWASGLLQQGVGAAQAAFGTNPYADPATNQQVAGLNSNVYTQLQPGLSGIAAYQPQQVQAGQVGSQQVGSQNIYAQDVAGWAGGTGIGHLSTNGMDLSGYLNPYTQSVIDQSDRDINRQSQIQQQANSGQAAMAGAFGGDRAAIVNTETQRNAADTMARTNAGLNAANFAQAQAQASTDINRQLQGATSQTQLGLQASQANQAAALQAGLANQSSTLRADQGNQTAALQAGQGNQYAGLQGQNLNLQGYQGLNGIYGQEQASRQAVLNAGTTNAMNNAMWPTNSASWLLSQGQKLPYGSITSTSGTGTSTPAPPSTLAQIGGGLTAGVGILGALGGSSGGLGALSTIGSGIKDAYNGLFGSSDPFSGAGGSFDAAGNAVSSGTSAASDAAFQAANTVPSNLTQQGFDAIDEFGNFVWRGGRVNFAQGGRAYAGGGIVGYADGGSVEDRQRAWDQRGRRWRTDPMAQDGSGETGGSPSMLPVTDATSPPSSALPRNVEPGGDYDDTYAPVNADGYGANAGIGALSPQDQSAAVRDLLATQAPPVTSVAGIDGDGAPGGPADQPTNAEPTNAASPIPVPPVPPGAPSPQGDPGAQGGPSKLTPPPQLAGAVQATAPGISAIVRREPNVLDNLNEGNTPAWMALIKAGAAMMSSRSPYAGVAIGEGLHVGADALTTAAHQQRQLDVQQQQAKALAEYRQGTLGVQTQKANTGQQRADTYGQVSAERIQLMQAQAQASLLRAQAAGGGKLTNAQLTADAIKDMMERNPGLTKDEALLHIRGLDIRQQNADTQERRANTAADQGDQRLKQTAARDQETRDNHDVVNKRNEVNDVLRPSVGMTNATSGTTKLPDAIQQVQTQRAAVAATLPAGRGVAGLQSAAAGGAPVQVATPQDAAALPPGTRFVGPDGVVRIRGGVSQ